MKYLISIFVIFSTLCAFAQEKTKEEIEQEKKFQEKAAQAQQDTGIVYGWTHSVVTGLNLTQISFKDWVQGGENALSYTLWLAGGSVQKMEITEWNNAYKLAFGQTRLGSQGLRKTDDEIFFESLLIYRMGLHINPYVSATLRTQFAKGYAYPNNVETPVSKFFDPAYLRQSIGVAYKPIPEVTTRLGVALREVIASEFTGYTDDPATTEIEKTKINGGMESVTDVHWNFAENMLLTSKLELFTPFTDPEKVILRSDNTISAKVNKYVTTSLNVTLINDVNVSPYTQIKQVLAIGLSYTLL
jgi:hypothetical protein